LTFCLDASCLDAFPMDSSPTNYSPAEQARHEALEVVRKLRASGHRAYFAGGCVRDELLGREPDDYDVATNATPDRISSLFKRTSQVGASFGVVLVKYGHSKSQGAIEVATFRSDGSYSDRRRPDHVTFSDPESDAQRRDFTVNALFLDPLSDVNDASHAGLPAHRVLAPAPRGGTVVDLVNGLPDLHARVIRAVGDADARLSEDHLRALRAVRLAAKLGFTIDPATRDAIQRHAAELSGLSRERIGEEVRMMLALARAPEALANLTALKLDAAVLQEPSWSGTRTNPVPIVEKLWGSEGPRLNGGLALAAWAIDRGLGPPHDLQVPSDGLWQGLPAPSVIATTSRWRDALCLSNEERDALAAILHWTGLLAGRWQGMPEAHRRRTAASPWFEHGLRLVGSLGGEFRSQSEQIREQAVRLANSAPGLAPARLVNGDDLARAGLPPGPRFRTLLELIYDAQLECRVLTREEGLTLGLELARSLSV
jgi:poly(A) polymerase